MLFNPGEHEPLRVQPWDAEAARAFIVRVVRETDDAYAAGGPWRLHPEDCYEDERDPNRGLYSGTAGTSWAVTKLARTYAIDLTVDYAAAIERCEREYHNDPYETDGGVVPSYFMGTAGIAAARYAVTGNACALDAIVAAMIANAANVTREIFWGSSGTAIPALIVRECDGDRRFDALLRSVQDEFWSSWEASDGTARLWVQDMYGKRQRYIGAGHGAFGNLLPFIRASDLLSSAKQALLRERIVDLLKTYVISDAGAANWYALAQPNFGCRVQWCHGAPGIILTLSAYPNDDERIEQFLQQGGEGIWRAGPVRKGPTLCHGTAGNGYALLRLARRTNDEMWMQRAQQFAMHAMNQVEQWRTEFGMPAFSLWTGDLGVACFVDSVLREDPAIPTFDVL